MRNLFKPEQNKKKTKKNKSVLFQRGIWGVLDCMCVWNLTYSLFQSFLFSSTFLKCEIYYTMQKWTSFIYFFERPKEPNIIETVKVAFCEYVLRTVTLQQLFYPPSPYLSIFILTFFCAILFEIKSMLCIGKWVIKVPLGVFWVIALKIDWLKLRNDNRKFFSDFIFISYFFFLRRTANMSQKFISIVEWVVIKITIIVL